MKTCTRCNRKLSAAAKCAGSEVCSSCAASSGELTAVPLLPIMRLRTYEDWNRMIDRLDT